jgi:hypothetical protein
MLHLSKILNKLLTPLILDGFTYKSRWEVSSYEHYGNHFKWSDLNISAPKSVGAGTRSVGTYPTLSFSK